MNNNQHDSQISAWFDGELTLAERAKVEQRLERSSDARDELMEVEQVSSWLSELPRDSLPRDFSVQVATLAKRVDVTTAPAAKPVRLSTAAVARSQRWSQSLGILLSAAAVLVVAVMLIDGPSRNVSDDSLSGPFAAANADSDPAELMAMTDGLRGQTADANDDLSEGMRGDRFDSESDNSLAEKQAFGGEGGLAGASPGVLTFGDNLERAEVGQVVEALERTGEQITVVRLTVVDRHVGLKNLQVLLARNDITLESATGRASQLGKLPTPAEYKSQLPADDDRLVAVYVEASQEQLAAVFTQIKRELQFQQMQVGRPIGIDQLALASSTLQSARGIQANRNKRSLKSRPSPRRPDEAKGGEAKGKADGSRKDLAQQRPASDATDGKASGKLTRDKEKTKNVTATNKKKRKEQLELERISRQLKLVLSRKMLDESTNKRPSAAKEPAAAPVAELARQQDRRNRNAIESAAAKPTDSPVPFRQLQVLFVLEIVPAGAKN